MGVVTGIMENQLLATGLALLVELIVFCECLDEYIQFTYAIANKMTLREMRDVWQHKLLFATVEVFKPHDEVTYMSDAQQAKQEVSRFFHDYKSYNICAMMKNFALFICTGHPSPRKLPQ